MVVSEMDCPSPDEAFENPFGISVSSGLAASSAGLAARTCLFVTYLQGGTAEFATIETFDGGTRFMPFHLNEPESPAAAGENIRNEMYRAHLAVVGKKG